MSESILVTSVTITEPTKDEDPRIVCWVTLCLWDAVKVRGAKLIRGRDNRVRLYWPQRKDKAGNHCPTTHAVTKPIHCAIEMAVLSAYRIHLEARKTSTHPHYGCYEAVTKEESNVA